MRLPVIPFLIAATLLGVVWYLFYASGSRRRILDVPRLSRLADIQGVETELAIAPDGINLAVVAEGDLWVFDSANGNQKQITHSAEAESFPHWTPDGKRITFTRGADSWIIDPGTGKEEQFRANATQLSWSQTSRTVFVRDRALWVANPGGHDETKLAEADMTGDIEIRSPRFSPNSLQIAFIKSQLGIRGEVWLVDALKGMARPLIADRPAENPLDVGWINNGHDLAYLTNRAGAYSIWYVDLTQMTVNPLTQPLVTVPLQRIGMAVSNDRLIVARHFVDSNISMSDGMSVTSSEKLEFQPAVSPDGTRVAYTIADENKFEIWTSGIRGDNPTFRTLGRQPRFSPNGLEVVYTHTDLTGNDDIWKFDIRNGSAERVTDADEIDVTPDWSPDGQSIAFASGRGGTISIWTTPASGGKRLRINDGGYAPRFSPNSKSILYSNLEALWTMDAKGGNIQQARSDLYGPLKPPGDRLAWPGFDVLKDGRLLLAPIEIRETSLWAIDLTYREN